MERHGIANLVGRGDPLAMSLLAMMILVTPGCRWGTPGEPPPDSRQLQIVCTTGQVGDMLKNIGGEHVVVESLMGPGVDPHLYEASPADAQRLASADMVFFNGLDLEARLTGLLDETAKQRPVYAVTHDLREKGDRWLRKVAGSKDTYDPHVWLDASLWARCVDYAATKLMEHDKAHATDYRQNADRYIAELEALHLLCKQQMAQIPGNQRVLVTAHHAFGYYGDAYEMEPYGVQGLSTANEVDQGTIEVLADLFVEHKTGTVFLENGMPEKGVQALIEACRVRGHELQIGGQLYSGALGPPNTPEGTYAGAMKHNATTIADALGE